MSPEELVQQLVNALSLGAIYALFALGLAVVFSVLGLLNFAYGELVTVSGYAMLLLARRDLPFWAMVVGAVPVAIAISMAMEFVAFRPLRRASPVVRLFSSFALAVIIQNLIRQLISPRPQGVPVPEFFNDAVRLGGVRIGVLPLLTAAIGGACLVGLSVFLKRSRAGLAMRAASQDFAVSRLVGVRADRVISLAFAISGALAGIAGVLWVSRRTSVSPTMGFGPVLKAFVATVLGGLGNLSGAVLGGFFLGALEIVLEVVLPAAWRPFLDAIALSIVVCVLYFRPQGILGGTELT
ncbi:MAG TPA: branched-chain amino acid ABC transporter permease [Actinomycetota bacterium]|nr:branched-chain amino acid ABC transporter permease [Actinomycetota bacterium]